MRVLLLPGLGRGASVFSPPSHAAAPSTRTSARRETERDVVIADPLLRPAGFTHLARQPASCQLGSMPTDRVHPRTWLLAITTALLLGCGGGGDATPTERLWISSLPTKPKETFTAFITTRTGTDKYLG